MKTKVFFTALLLCVTIGVLAEEPKAQLDSVITETYPSSKTKVEYSYNANGTVNSDILSNWKTNAWSQSYKNDYTYDAYNKISIAIKSRMNIYTSAWTPSTKYEYAYNDKGDQILRKEYKWDTDHWTIRQLIKSSYTYDTNGRIVSSIDTTAVSELTWQQILQSVYGYDDTGRQISKEISLWDAKSETWAKESIYSYTYDADDNLILILCKSWKEAEIEWVNSKKEEMTYDANGYLLTKILSIWTTENGWLQFEKYTYYYHGYNTAINQLEAVSPSKGVKFLRDGQLFILRDGKTYTITGQEVK